MQYFLPLIALLVAAFIGAQLAGGRGNTAAVGAVLAYCAVIGISFAVAHLVGSNPVKVMSYIGLGVIVFGIWVVFFPPRKDK